MMAPGRWAALANTLCVNPFATYREALKFWKIRPPQNSAIMLNAGVKLFTPVNGLKKTQKSFRENGVNHYQDGLSKELVYPYMLLLKAFSVLKILPFRVSASGCTIRGRNSLLDLTASATYFACGFIKTATMGSAAIYSWFQDDQGFEFCVTITLFSLVSTVLATHVILFHLHMPETVILFNAMDFKRQFRNLPLRWYSREWWRASVFRLLEIGRSTQRFGVKAQMIYCTPYLFVVCFFTLTTRMYFAPDSIENTYWCIPDAWKSMNLMILSWMFDVVVSLFGLSHFLLLTFLLLSLQIVLFEPVQHTIVKIRYGA